MAPQRRQFAVFGDPVAHSLSPPLFEWLFAHFGLAARYERARVPSSELEHAVERVRSGDLQGASVTLPHKERIPSLVDEVDKLSHEIGACNCIARCGNDRVRGHNTDAAGFRLALAHRDVSLVGARVLILGSGGAARAAAFATAEQAQMLFLANRTQERALRLASDLVAAGRAIPASDPAIASRGLAGEALEPKATVRCGVTTVPMNSPALQSTLQEANVVINATRVGLSDPSSDPLPQECMLSSGHAVLDMVYQPLQTALLMRANHAGAIAVDGLWMLLYQAFEQFKLWTGLAVDPNLAEHAHDHLSRMTP